MACDDQIPVGWLVVDRHVSFLQFWPYWLDENSILTPERGVFASSLTDPVIAPLSLSTKLFCVKFTYHLRYIYVWQFRIPLFLSSVFCHRVDLSIICTLGRITYSVYATSPLPSMTVVRSSGCARNRSKMKLWHIGQLTVWDTALWYTPVETHVDLNYFLAHSILRVEWKRIQIWKALIIKIGRASCRERVLLMV